MAESHQPMRLQLFISLHVLLVLHLILGVAFGAIILQQQREMLRVTNETAFALSELAETVKHP